jgi:hypothetical protein
LVAIDEALTDGAASHREPGAAERRVLCFATSSFTIGRRKKIE